MEVTFGSLFGGLSGTEVGQRPCALLCALKFKQLVAPFPSFSAEAEAPKPVWKSEMHFTI